MTDAGRSSSSCAVSRRVKLTFSNPHTRVIEDSASKLVIDLPDFPVRSELHGGAGVRVSVKLNRHTPSVEVSRSLYTSNEAYLVPESSDAELVITDHFLTALQHCRSNQRTIDNKALLDHFLFRTVPGEETYVRGVLRVGHGRTARWDGISETVQTYQQERVEDPITVAFSEALRILENSLEDVMASVSRAAPHGTVANLLSGGVDSTLLQVMLPPGTVSLSATIDSPEFAPETERALAASKLTGSRHILIRAQEREYLRALERFVTSVGLPPHHMQSVLLGELLRELDGEKPYLLTAQLADALFGLGFSHRTTMLRRWGWLPLLTGLVDRPAGLKPARLHRAEALLSAVRQPIASTQGLAARAACYTDFPFVEQVFGRDEVEKRLARRLQYVLETCPLLSPDRNGIDAHLEAGHLLDYFCDDAVSIWRQASMTYHGFLIAPFTHPKIASSSLIFPRYDRYSRGGKTKPALKALLRKRLPEYDTDQTKLSWALPIQRFLDSGLLSDPRYSTPPDFFPKPLKTDLRHYPPWIAWGIITISMWRELAVRSHVHVPITFSRQITAEPSRGYV
jgi:hypothetical protein